MLFRKLFWFSDKELRDLLVALTNARPVDFPAKFVALVEREIKARS
jgi:hypothetical protein